MGIETPDNRALAHEALDRCHVMASMIDDHLLGHPYVQGDAEVKALVEQSSAALAAAYQLVGGKRFAEVLEDGPQRTRYADSACDVHKSVTTSAPVCIVCMGEEIVRLRKLAKASLDARSKEAKAEMSLENAQANFHRFDVEERAYEKAMVEAREADRLLREEIGNHE